MIVKISGSGKSFKGLSTYLTHDPNAISDKRVAWTHTLNLANDHVPSAVDEMYWTAQNGELLKQEAGIRADVPRKIRSSISVLIGRQTINRRLSI